MNNPIYLILICISAIIFGQLLLKSGMSSFGAINKLKAAEIVPTFKKIILNKKIITGFFLYGLSSVLWIYILSIVDLSFAFPFLSIAYVGVPTAAAIFLNEKLYLHQWLGIVVVVIGLIFVAAS